MLSSRFEEALTYAFQLHQGQARKGSGVPYVSHLLAVTALVLEYGGDEDQAIAALLHDAVEDQGGLPVLAQIRDRFGECVADIVAACSDSFETPKPPWRARKERYLAHLPEKLPAARLVSLADKVHNARTILADYGRIGEEIWGHFKGGKDGTLWYYQALVDAFRTGGDEPLIDELARLVGALEDIAS
ncbi:MAG: HD domain-containing protein [Chloroflexota bacterium]